MGFKITSGAYGLYANTKTATVNKNLGESVEKLASGLEINRASDDPTGLAIANSLSTQSAGLSQSIKNVNNAVGLVQIADNAMQEMVEILDRIKTKSIQAGQAGQTLDTRMALQNDVNKLLEEFDSIAETTTYNSQTLLSGSFQNKEFQVGAYANNTIGLSIPAMDVLNVGDTTKKTFNMTYLNDYKKLVQGQSVSLTVMGMALQDIVIDTKSGTGVGMLSDHINAYTDQIGVRSNWKVELKSTASVLSGDLTGFKINGVLIGNVQDIKVNDADGKLVAAIRSVENLTGVRASIAASGTLTLNSIDGRGIQIENFGNIISTSLEGQKDTVIPTAIPAAGVWMINGVDLSSGLVNISSIDSLTNIAGVVNANAATTGVLATLDVTGKKLVLSGTIKTINGFDGAGVDAYIEDVNNSMSEYGMLEITKAGSEDIETVFSTKNVISNSVATNYDLLPAGLQINPGVVLINGVDILTDSNGNQLPLSDYDTADKIMSLINDKASQTEVIGTIVNGRMTLSGRIATVSGFNGAIVDPNGGIPASINNVDLGWERAVSLSTKNLNNVRADSMLMDEDLSMEAMSIVDSALKEVDSARADIGSVQNRLETVLNNISVVRENVVKAEGDIRDVDYASETADFNKNKLLAQAGTYALTQANAIQQNVLKLFQ